ncbi:MAG: alpha/beta fold hydrolase [Candidatus Nanopelagicales bacterium]
MIPSADDARGTLGADDAQVLLRADRAVPVVLVHPFPVHAEFLTPLAVQLRSAGWTVLTPDLPGFGTRADELTDIDVEPSLDYFAEDLATQLDELGIGRAIIGGVSLGGYVAMAFLRLFPQRVAGLLLVDTKAASDSDDAREARLAFAHRVEDEGVGWVADAMRDRLLGPTAQAEQPHTVSWVNEAIGSAQPAALAWAQRAMAVRPDSGQLLADYPGPALVVVGIDDVLSTAAEAAAMADAMAAAELRVIADAGHFAALENTPAVAAAISDWLTRRA